MKSSPVLREVLRLRLTADAAGCRSATHARERVPTVYAETVDEVENTFVRYPIPLLQVVGRHVVPFLYEVDWREGASVATLRAEHRDRIQLLPRVADRLVILGPMLRPLIELHWTKDVARWTGVGLDDSALQAHLFGAERVSFPIKLISRLSDLQGGRCFYCDDSVVGRGHVDHFLAWSRWANDAIENLVLADRCNLAKSDHLVASEHVQRWLGRVHREGESLTSIARGTGWLTDPARSVALVRTTYSHVSPGTPLWRVGGDFVLADGPLDV
jgi:hypothetical protein